MEEVWLGLLRNCKVETLVSSGFEAAVEALADLLCADLLQPAVVGVNVAVTAISCRAVLGVVASHGAPEESQKALAAP